ncbi:MAG: hypothetical protein KBB14_17995 [Thermoanaerobaculia bacterium]|nr:hypothetical protein [Thermoanaerobaculia bacterium]
MYGNGATVERGRAITPLREGLAKGALERDVGLLACWTAEKAEVRDGAVDCDDGLVDVERLGDANATVALGYDRSDPADLDWSDDLATDAIDAECICFI